MIHHLHEAACSQRIAFLRPMSLMATPTRRSSSSRFSVIREQHATRTMQSDTSTASDNVLAHSLYLSDQKQAILVTGFISEEA